MTTPTDKLDDLLQQARTAAKTLADELEYALELLREDESIEIDLQRLKIDWNRARTELAMAVYGTSTLPDGGLGACEKAIADRRRYGDLEAEVARAQSELRYLEQSPAGLVQELTDLIAVKRAARTPRSRTGRDRTAAGTGIADTRSSPHSRVAATDAEGRNRDHVEVAIHAGIHTYASTQALWCVRVPEGAVRTIRRPLELRRVPKSREECRFRSTSPRIVGRPTARPVGPLDE